MCYLRKNKQIDQWNRIEHPQIEPHEYNPLIFDKGTQATQWTKHSLKQMVLEQLDIHMKKKKNPDTDLTPFTKINLKWIIDLSVKCKTVKFLEGNRRKPR